jgi:hypothetical protein
MVHCSFIQNFINTSGRLGQGSLAVPTVDNAFLCYARRRKISGATPST